MISKFSKHISVLLSLLMIITAIVPMFVIPATAEGTLTVTDDKLGLSWTNASNSSGKANWSASGNNVTGTATGYTSLIFGRTITTKLTITNNHSDDRTLSFSYTLTGGGSVSGTISGTSGSYSATLAAGASTTITLTSPSGSNTNTLSITGIQLLSSGNVTSTFLAPENGSYTVDGEAVTAQTTKEKAATASYTLKATPASGYMFFGWYSQASNSYVSYDAENTQVFGSDPQLKPVFVPTTTALFGVGTARFADLTEACNFANSSSASTKTVVLLNNGTVSGSHTIPAGITLLVPFDSENTLYTSEPACTSSFLNNVAWVEPTAYRTLTLAADANITVNGAISISAKHAASNGNKPYSGAPTGPVGWVNMIAGSKITLNSGANLYAWGFIQGAGNITVKNGATVYENFQFTDFRGGTNLGQMTSEGLVFPINQYYVQNIEVPTRYEAGAKETLYTTAYASSMALGGSAPFIGEGGMFVINSGYVVKDYIENRDRLQVDVYGDIDMSSMTVDVGQAVDSSNYVLPITNNITINLNSGTTTVKQSVALTPGVEMTIDKDAVLDIGYSSTALNGFNTSGHNLIVYDRDEWFYGFNMETGEIVENTQYAFGSSTGFRPLPFAPGRTYNRTAANDLNDAFIDVNGTIVANGFIYTTTGGAAIKSTGKTGEIVLNNGSGFDMFTFQANGGASLGIMMNSAALLNGDGTYLNTITFDEDFNPLTYAEPGTTFDYCATHDCWYTGECAACAATSNFEITFIVNGKVEYVGEIEVGTVPSYSGTPTKAADVNNHYTFAGWATSENGTVLESLPAVTANATYYAVFTANAHDKNKIEDSKHYCFECNYLIGSCADKNNDHKCDVGEEDMTCGNAYLTEVEGKSATCGADGWNSYYKCSCGKLYADSEAKTEISNLEAWKLGDGKISATGNHSFGTKVSDKLATPADCDNAATYYVQCDNCDAVSNSKTVAVGEANGHAFNEKVSDKLATPADCDNAATYYVQCDNCDAVSNSKTVAVGEANGHAFNEKVSDKLATSADCDNAATYYVQCDNCDAVSNSKTVAVGEANGHAFNEKVSDKLATSADCDNAATYYVQCDNCDAVSNSKTVAVGEANGHDFEYSSNTDPVNTHSKYCLNNCGEVNSAEKCTFGDDHKCEFCGNTEMFAITWLFDGGVMDEQTREMLENDGFVVTDTYCIGYFAYGNFGPGTTGITKTGYTLIGYTDENGNFNDGQTVFTLEKDMTFTLVWAKNYTLTVIVLATSEIVEVEVHSGANLLEMLFIEELRKNIPSIGAELRVNEENFNGIRIVSGYSYYDETNEVWDDLEGMTMPESDFTIYQDVKEIGWQIDETGSMYVGEEDAYLYGWNYIEEDYDDVQGGAWYYFDNEGYRVEGISRVPYPEMEIEGNEYVSEDSVNTEFIDNSEAWFIFDENGKFQYTETGIIDHNGTTRYAVNGMIPWHYGLATDGTDYYYFVGDTVDGGNKLGTNNVYMIRTNGLTINGKEVIEKGVYTYDADGKLCLYEGIIKEGNVLRYYYDYCMTAKSGLIKLDVDGEVKFIYVSSSDAKLTAMRERYIGENEFNLVPGKYEFDVNGYLVDAKFTTKTGIFFEDGAYYYYENGERAYAGLIQYSGTASDGTVYDNAYIYVRYNGELATGRYWITKNNGLMDAKPYEFNENGIMDMRNGIVEENGSLYYYEDGILAEGKGLIKIGEDFYYVRSSGEVVNNCIYWISNTNDYDVLAKKYVFDENGVMQDVKMKDTTLNGVVDGYYYVDGQIAYGAGPIVWNGDIYYVRSNGQVATGTYWTTVENEILDSAIHEFDESGKLIK